MAFVLDASVVHAWAFDEPSPIARFVWEKLTDDSAISPSLWWFEVRNGLLVGERRGRTKQQDTARALRDLSALSIALDRSPDEAAVMSLARRHRLTVYDASYLELALREGLPLATLDAALAEAARREGVTVLGDAE